MVVEIPVEMLDIPKIENWRHTLSVGLDSGYSLSKIIPNVKEFQTGRPRW